MFKIFVRSDRPGLCVLTLKTSSLLIHCLYFYLWACSCLLVSESATESSVERHVQSKLIKLCTNLLNVFKINQENTKQGDSFFLTSVMVRSEQLLKSAQSQQ